MATELLKNLCVKENKSVVIVTHDSRITDLADTIYQIEDGNIKTGQMDYSEFKDWRKPILKV
jgi:ABC-type lipoprotein export system ATPase subunit